MKCDQTLEVEITIRPARGRRGSQGRKPGTGVPAPPVIPRTARLMALAIRFQDTVDRGDVRDYADIARLGYVSRARITQIMNLLNLAPDIQERLLFDAGKSPVRETQLRPVVRFVRWDDQRQEFGALEEPR